MRRVGQRVVQRVPMERFVGVDDVGLALDALDAISTPSASCLATNVNGAPPRSRKRDDDAALAGLVLPGDGQCDPLRGSPGECDRRNRHRRSQLRRQASRASISDAIASRILCARTKAVLCWQSRSRESWKALMPFAALTMMQIAASRSVKSFCGWGRSCRLVTRILLAAVRALEATARGDP